MKTYNVTFGVRQDFKGRWVPLLNGTPCCSLSYKSRERALSSSQKMVRSMYKPFTDFQGNQVTFIFSEQSL